MRDLSVRYSPQGFRVLCFPCNEFLSQEPWKEAEIKEWVTNKWPKLNPVLFSKVNVNGDNEHAVFTFLKKCFPGDVVWNFASKFVIGRDGIPVQRFDKKQGWDEIEKCIVEELAKGQAAAEEEKAEAKVDAKADEKADEKADDVEDMKEALEAMVTEDKQVKMEKFVAREDEIREIADGASKEVIEAHAFGEEENVQENAKPEAASGQAQPAESADE